MDRINAFLLTAHANGRRPVLMIDEAQNLRPPKVLEQIRLLTNLETPKQKLLQIFLVGQPELRTLLSRQGLRQLDQRITARFHLKPLDAKETGDYIRHRLAVAGVERPLFTPAAVRRIHAIQVTPAIVDKSAWEVRGEVGVTPKRRAPTLTLAFAAVALALALGWLARGWLDGAGVQAVSGWRAVWPPFAPQTPETQPAAPVVNVAEAEPRADRQGAPADPAPVAEGPGPVVPEAATAGGAPADPPVVAALSAVQSQTPSVQVTPITPITAGSPNTPGASGTPDTAQASGTPAAPSPSAAPTPLVTLGASGTPGTADPFSAKGAPTTPAAPGPQVIPSAMSGGAGSVVQPPSTGVVQAHPAVPGPVPTPPPTAPVAALPPVTAAVPMPAIAVTQAAPVDLRHLALPEADAMRLLLSRWGLNLKVLPPGDPCDSLPAYGLRCERDRGGWRALRALDHPALLRLRQKKGQAEGYLVLAAMDPEGVTLAHPEGNARVTRAELNALLSGHYTLVWQPPPMGVASIGAGSSAESVRWLRKLLSQVPDTGITDTESGTFDAAVGAALRRFQVKYGLNPDGIAGPKTLVQLNNAVGMPGIPKLSGGS